jgi:hypothetical protein
MGEQETIWAAVGVLRYWMEQYGVPRALYTDWNNVYVREPTPKELLHGKPSLTQSGCMCERLGIKIIAAGSPEANVDYHLPMPGAKRLREIFRLETERVLGNDWVVRHENRFYPVEGQSRSYAPAKSKVTVCEWEDGTREIH